MYKNVLNNCVRFFFNCKINVTIFFRTKFVHTVGKYLKYPRFPPPPQTLIKRVWEWVLWGGEMCFAPRNKLYAAPFLATYCKRKRTPLPRPGGDFGKIVGPTTFDGVRNVLTGLWRAPSPPPCAKINKPAHPQLSRVSSVRRLRATPGADGCWGRK